MPFLRVFSNLGLGAARKPGLGRLAAWLFIHMNSWLPIQRLRETKTLIAFYHPHPVHATHILIVPRRSVASLQALTPQDQDFLADLFRVVQELVNELKLEERGYRLVVNGGRYQDFPLLHFHLIAD